MHTLLVLLQDKPGALHRAVTVFRRRGYNIASLHVERAEIAGISRMTVATEAPGSEQLRNELERLVDVLSVREMPHVGDPIPVPAALSPRMQADGICDDGEAADVPSVATAATAGEVA